MVAVVTVILQCYLSFIYLLTVVDVSKLLCYFDIQGIRHEQLIFFSFSRFADNTHFEIFIFNAGLEWSSLPWGVVANLGELSLPIMISQRAGL